MDKSDFISLVGRKLDLANAQAKRTVDAVFEALGDALVGGDEVRMTGFGVFGLATRKASQGRNPQTGAPTQIPEQRQIKLRVGKGLKDAVKSAGERDRRAA